MADVSISLMQRRMMESTSPLVAVVCGVGCGKTRGSSWTSLVRAASGEHVLSVAPTHAMVSKVLFRDAVMVARDNGFRYRPVKSPYHSIHTPSGDIVYGAGSVPDSSRGENADTVLMDEATIMRGREAFDILYARSGRGPRGRKSVIVTTTPKGRQNWMHDVIYDADGKVRDGVDLITASSLDAPFLSDEYKRGLISQYGIDTPWFRQEVLGEWVEWSGGIIDVSRLRIAPRPGPLRLCRAWDTASSSKSSADYTASCLMGMTTDCSRVHIIDVTQWRGTYGELRPRIIQRMSGDPVGCAQVIEDTAAGQVIRSDLMRARELSAYAILPVEPIGDKITRCLSYSSRVAGGMVTYEAGSWNRNWLDEQAAFGPKCEHDDMVDATAHAYNWLAMHSGKTGMATLGIN